VEAMACRPSGAAAGAAADEVIMDEAQMQACWRRTCLALGPQATKWDPRCDGRLRLSRRCGGPPLVASVGVRDLGGGTHPARCKPFDHEELALLLGHEGRHYKKLMPSIPSTRRLLRPSCSAFWPITPVVGVSEEPTPEAGHAHWRRSSKDAVRLSTGLTRPLRRGIAKTRCQAALPADAC